MPERNKVIPLWTWIVGAILVIGIIFAGIRTVQIQHHLRAVQDKLEHSNDEATAANAQRAEVKAKLD
jgi:cell division protein FtsL